MANNGRIVIDVDINGHVKGFEQAIQQASNKLATMPLVKDNPLAKAIEKAKREMADLNKLAAKGISSKGDQSKLENQYERVKRSIEDMASAHQKMANMSSKDFKKLIDKDVIVGYDEAKKAVDEYAKSLEQLTTEKRKLAGKQGAQTRRTNQMANLEGSTDKADIAKLNTLREKFNAAKDEIDTMSNSINTKAVQALEKLKQSLESMGLDTSNITNVKTALESVEDQLINTDKIVEDTQQSFKDNDAIIEQFRTILKNLGYDITEVGNEFEAASDKMDLTNTISRNIKNFFSLTNAIYLFRRAIMSSFNTVKELDAVMTETAVVTDFSVSDMWDKLPEYTKMANELGATTKGAYETATLYYQQGLKTNEVMAVSAETMKMARIAGLDYATATDYMTAALRGFNMEINTDSAERVNDVYSRLAAVTASNTQEISVAMTKVASLAHNANMEFETTAAFLAQIIETTRESAETAGTALKTVVARFTEVKKLYNEGELLGTDEEGEEIDVNKVATALRSAGIDMNKYFTGQVGLDDIFMELASKWDSLDKVQQRYIATMAAGSRQQSRFIAMMSNYQRTLELVGEAENSAGAGQKQFEKTMESLEATLNRLKNAWDTFLMGIANSDAIKWVLNLLTDLLTKLNEIISTVSGESGFTKFFTSVGLALGGGAIAKGGLNLLSGGLATILGREKNTKSGLLGSLLFGGEGLEGITKGLGVVENNLKNLKFETISNNLKVLGGSISGVWEALLPILPYIVVGGAIVAGLIAIGKAIYEINNQDKVLAEKAEGLREAVANVKEEVDNTRVELETLESKKDLLDEYIVGTQKWRDAVMDLNQEYKAFLETHEDAKQFMSFDSKGNYVFDYEGYQKYLASLEASANNTENLAASYDIDSAKASLTKVLKGIDIKAYDDRYMKVSLSNEQKQQLYEDILAGNVNASNYEEYIKAMGFKGVATDFQDVADSSIEVKNALFDLAQALNEYAKKFGLPTISENEYDKRMLSKQKDLENLDGEELIKRAEALGIDYVKIAQQLGEDFVLGFNDPKFKAALSKEIAAASGLSFNSENLSQEAANTFKLRNAGFNATQQQQFSINLNTLESSGIQLSSSVVAQAANYTEQNKDIQELIDSLLKLLDIENTHEQNVENLKDTYAALGEEFSDDTIDKVTAKWEQDEKELLKLQKVLKETPEDYEAIAKAASDALDTDFDTEDVEKYYDYLERIAAGGEDANKALIELQSLTARDFLTDLGVDLDTIGSWIDDINGREVQIGGTADFSEIYTQLVTLLMQSGKTFEDANAMAEQYFKNMGYEMHYEDMPADYVDIPELSGVGAALGGVAVGVKSIPLNRKKVTWVKTGYTPSNSGGSGGSRGSGGSGGGGGGGSNSNPDRWLNPYDKFYNLTEQINEALRQREKLERQYDRILKNRWSLQKDIQGNTQARLASLKQEIEMNKRLLAGRQEQLDAVLNEKFLDEDKNIRTFRDFGVAKYANYNTARGTVEIDWEGLERLSGTTDTQLGSVIEDFVKRLEELQDQWEDTDKVIEDLEDEVQEILDINKEEYLSFEQRVFDAIVDREQKLIDGYSDLSETISNDNEEVLNALSESIDLSRQIRDNTKTEEEIAEKEARLAYLRRDTSGANDLAIKQLEKELEQARESYGDTLIDQELDRLSQANEDAAKQRERQIEIMQAQLDWQQKVGFFWNEVINLLQNNYGQTDEGIAKELVDLLEATDAFSGMSEFQKADWLQKLHTEWLESESGHASWRLSEAKAASMGESGKESNYSISADQTTAGKALRYDYDRDMWLDEDEGWYTGVSYNAESNLFDYTGYSSKASRDAEAAAQAAKAQAEATKRSSVGVGSYINASGAPIYTSAYGGSPLTQYFGNDPKYLVLDDYGSSWMVRWHGLSSGITGFFRKGDVRGYKTGGLVNTTGPAWLDGTPQRPEFVLNADQTQAFMKLVDKLGNGTGAGDNYFDVNIVVDQISSDYDVDRLVDRIKQKITEDAQYRNVNAINWIR